MTVWLLSTCVLIAVLMLLRRALRGRADPRLVYALWLLAAVRVLVPGSLFDLPVSVSGLAESAGVTQAVEDARYATQREETYGSKHSGQADVEDIHGLEDMDWVRRESWLGSQNITDVEVVDAQEVPAEEAGFPPRLLQEARTAAAPMCAWSWRSPGTDSPSCATSGTPASLWWQCGSSLSVCALPGGCGGRACPIRKRCPWTAPCRCMWWTACPPPAWPGCCGPPSTSTGPP